MNFINKLLIYGERYPTEAQIVQQFIRLIKNDPSCYKRNNVPGHFTGSSWVVNRDFSKTLLIHHRKLNRWIQLGGHADGDLDLLGVAKRELFEESGLTTVYPFSNDIFDLAIHTIPATKSEKEHFHYDVRFLFIANDSEKLTPSAESEDIRWVELDKLETVTDEESVLKMKRKCKQISSTIHPNEK